MSKTPLPRSITKILNFHLNTMPAVVLSGARQTGKSTLVKDIGQDTRKFYSLDDINVLDMAQNDPKSLISESGLITLDEIQREPKLLLAVKHDIDVNRQPSRFLLTGCANLLLMQKVSESLAGRASYLNLWPLTRREQLGQGSCGIWEQLIGNDERTWIDVIAADKTDMEDWRSFARRGGFPVPAIHQTTVEERQIWFNGYMQTYLERDLQQLSVISALPDFQRLVRAICFRLGGLSNQTNLSHDTSIPQPTVHRYLNLLETSCLLVRLTPVPFNSTYFIRKCFDPTVPSKRSVEGTVGSETRRQDSLQYHRIPGSIRIRLGTRSGVPNIALCLEHLQGNSAPIVGCNGGPVGCLCL